MSDYDDFRVEREKMEMAIDNKECCEQAKSNERKQFVKDLKEMSEGWFDGDIPAGCHMCGYQPHRVRNLIDKYGD